MCPIRFIKCYGNPVVTLITSILFLIFAEDGGANAIKAIEPNIAGESLAILFGYSIIIFSLLAIWVFSIGALVALIQIIYGVFKYSKEEENKKKYVHYFYGFLLTIFSYIIIFSVPLNLINS